MFRLRISYPAILLAVPNSFPILNKIAYKMKYTYWTFIYFSISVSPVFLQQSFSMKSDYIFIFVTLFKKFLVFLGALLCSIKYSYFNIGAVVFSSQVL